VILNTYNSIILLWQCEIILTQIRCTRGRPASAFARVGLLGETIIWHTDTQTHVYVCVCSNTGDDGSWAGNAVNLCILGWNDAERTG